MRIQQEIREQYPCRTPYMQNLYAEADKSLLNKIVRVKIEEATMNSLSGKIAEE